MLKYIFFIDNVNIAFFKSIIYNIRKRSERKKIYNRFKCVIKCILDASKTCSINKAC